MSDIDKDNISRLTPFDKEGSYQEKRKRDKEKKARKEEAKRAKKRAEEDAENLRTKNMRDGR